MKKTMMKKHMLLSTLLVLSAAPLVFSFSTGAPDEACQSLSPNPVAHAAIPQNTSVPYGINLDVFLDPSINEHVYTPGLRYNITFRPDTSGTFRGVLIQPRLIADGTTVVGAFENPEAGSIYKYSFCARPNGSITHTTGNDKTEIRASWIAPPIGTGDIRFMFAVVRVRDVYWAAESTIVLSERSCISPPTYLLDNSCVERCPNFFFGDYRTAMCEPFPPSIVGHPDAFRYAADILSNDTFGPIFTYRYYLNLTYFQNQITRIAIDLVNNRLVESLFSLRGGRDQIVLLFSNISDYDPVTRIHNQYPQVRIMNNTVIIEDIVIFDGRLVDDELRTLPSQYSFNLGFSVVGGPGTSVILYDADPPPVATVRISNPPDPCDDNVCMNGASCSSNIDNTNFTCTCPPAYTGRICDILFNSCAFEPCLNGANCTNTDEGRNYTCECSNEFTGSNCETQIDHCDQTGVNCNNGSCVDGVGTFTCECFGGYTGEFCEIEINECESITCANGGCIDLLNDYLCDCYPGYTGRLCETDIDYCSFDSSAHGPCDDIGASNCNDGNLTYTCSCLIGFTGYNCSQDINECEPNPCMNGANCTNNLFGFFDCDCSSGFSGTLCEIDITPCDPPPCGDVGVCIDQGEGRYRCVCPDGFTGPNCTDEIPYCTPTNPCNNGGTCTESDGPGFTCMCQPDFTGSVCEVEVLNCQEDSCMNGGTCIEGIGQNISCNCTEGFDGDRCQNDLPYCRSDSCFNEGTCIEGRGPLISCNCTEGFGGDRCQDDLPFCRSDSCFNEGTCIEGRGPVTSCNCTAGFEGNRCELDTLNCRVDTCSNNGTCVEGIGLLTTCECPNGFSGPYCETDLTFCTNTTCLNGGACIDGKGDMILCECIDGYAGMLCDDDDPSFTVCEIDSCSNNGTCVELYGPNSRCDCLPGFNGSTCDIDVDFCETDTCLNGGTCEERLGVEVFCNCVGGFDGVRCEDDLPFCELDSCQNSGTCIEGYGSSISCNCTEGYGGDRCENDLNFCQERQPQCQNGGSCVEGVGKATYCECDLGFTGLNCETYLVTDGCRDHSDCPNNMFCQVNCSSDGYPSHVSLLVQPIELTGTSFVSIPQSRFPDFSGSVSIFAYFRQQPGNEGYLFFYGTSPSDRNLALYLDAGSSPTISLFYTSTDQTTRVVTVPTSINDDSMHFLAVTVDVSGNSAKFYLDGLQIASPGRALVSPDLMAMISPTNRPSLLVGARLVRHYRFVGDIFDIIVFNSLISAEFITRLQDQYFTLSNPTGECVPYFTQNQECPAPVVAPSLICQSVTQLCDPSLACLYDINSNKYSCQPKPASCTSDANCMPDFFCGSPLPRSGHSLYDNPGSVIPGETVFLQRDAMSFDGNSIVSIPMDAHPQMTSDLTIFATVCQREGNDGYIVGKGVNDRMRDFGLYLRSSKRTVWLAYGADGPDDSFPGFREILFFYNISVAESDGSCHSVAAVVDGVANRAVLYIDAVPVAIRTPLPSTPDFKDRNNMLYVGGRPGTRLFRFDGTISNLFISTGAITFGQVVVLHQQAFSGSGINTVTTTNNSVRYCYRYVRNLEKCYVDSFSNNDFRCQPPATCVPVYNSSAIVGLPMENSDQPLRIEGQCVMPCSRDCQANGEDLQCGADGRTYYNTCFRQCASVQLLQRGRCPEYAPTFLSSQ